MSGQTTLYTLFRNTGEQDNISVMGEDKIADTILSLIKLNEETHNLHGTSPEDILVNEKTNTLEIRTSRVENPFYEAPEVLFFGKNPTPSSKFFSLAQLIFFVIYGRNYYEYRNIPLTTLPEIMEHSESLLGYNGNQKLDEALKVMSGGFSRTDNSGRAEGLRPLLEFISAKTSAANITLKATGTSGILRLRVPGAGLAIKQGMVLKDKSGRQFQVLESINISFRPGVHSYTVKSALISENASLALGVHTRDNPGNITKLFELDGTAKRGTIEASRDKTREYIVVILNGSASVPRYKFNVPASQNANCLIEFRYRPTGEITVVIIDKNTRKPMEPVSDNTLTFKI